MAGRPVIAPSLRFLDGGTVEAVVAEAKRILEEIGVRVEHAGAVELLDGAGARVRDGGRVRIGPEVVERCLGSVVPEFRLWDRDVETSVRVGGDDVSFAPGSAAIQVYDLERGEARPSTAADCVAFARLTEVLPHFALQATCVVPSDVPREAADRTRLALALRHCRKPIVTGTFAADSFERMRRMLVCVRGSEEALREKPLAVFDCCPTAPLNWSELTTAALVDAARAGVPAELISMPMTGATSPVTLLGAVTQHTAESLSGVVIHQLAAPGAPLVWGACACAFDMRHGTSPTGAVEAMMMHAATAQVGRYVGLPTHAYLALSDSKVVDYQGGLESGTGALFAVLAGVNIASGPGMLELTSCQSAEKLILDHEACALALRAGRGMVRRDEPMALELVREGIAAERFLGLGHTRKWFREELHFPGPTIDRQGRDAWRAAGSRTAAERAREEKERLLAGKGAPPLDPEVEAELHRQMEA